jgi:hypothetical protein
MSAKPENFKEQPAERFDGSVEEWLELSYDMQWYHYNQESRAEEKRQRRAERRDWARAIKEDEGCHLCDEDVGVALDWHHIAANKDGNIGEMASKGASKERLRKEMEKCVVLCANCHRKVEHGLLEV